MTPRRAGASRRTKFATPPLVVGLAVLGSLSLLPVVSHNQFLQTSMILVFIFALFAASWDLTFGVTGLPNFGPGLPFGVGGFMLYLVPRQVNPLVAVFTAGLAAGAFGILMWTPSIRLRGSYLSIVTLAMLLLFQDASFVLTSEEGVSLGFSYYAVPLVTSYYFALAIAGGSSFVLYLLSKSKLGLRLRAIKDDEVAARASSINVEGHKLFVFMLSAFFAGMAGAYYTLYNSNVNYTIFSVTNDFLPIVITVIGGPGTIFGAWLGSLLVELPSLYLLAYGPYSLIIYGGTMIVVMLFVKGGIMGGLTRISERIRGEGSKSGT
jgi:branched-chain amino acid transport system permease protein